MKKVKKVISIEMRTKKRKNQIKDKPMDYMHEYRLAVMLFCFFSLLYLGLLFLVPRYRIVAIDELGQWGLPIIAGIWFIGFIGLRDLWFTYVVFRWKRPYMKEYYRAVEKKLKKMRKNDWSLEEELVFVPKGPNEKMLGILESVIYAGAFFSRNLLFIGIIAGVRSYLTIYLHPNKEESEFYLMGVLGSLIYAVAGAFLFAWISAYWFDVSWFAWIKWI